MQGLQNENEVKYGTREGTSESILDSLPWVTRYNAKQIDLINIFKSISKW